MFHGRFRESFGIRCHIKLGSQEFSLKKHGRLPSHVKPRVRGALREILTNPHIGVPLVGPLKGLWRMRIGKYRVIYEINEKEKTVVFHDVDLRKKFTNESFDYWSCGAR